MLEDREKDSRALGKASQNLENILLSRIFGHENTAVAAVLKRTERLTSALYLISSFIPDHDPLRTDLRKTGLLLLSDIATGALRHRPEEVLSRIASLVALLEVAEASRYLSPMNGKILREKYGELTNALVSLSPDAADLLSRMVEGPLDLSSSPSQGQTPLLSRSIGGSQKGRRQSPHSLRKGRSSSKEIDSANRRDLIIGAVKDKGKASIKDISQIVSDCSEKTLQREVLSLVSQGVLKKEGEKRWSVYTLA